MTQNQSNAPTQKTRWFKYGSNVFVLIAATLVIVVLVNWIVAKRLPEWTRGRAADWVRYDLTSTRQNSLSPQTLSVLKQLDSDVQVTMIYAKGSEESAKLFQQVEDLLTEYHRRDSRVQFEQIDPTTDREKFDAFTAKLLGRFKGQVDQAKATISESKGWYAEIRKFADDQGAALTDAMVKCSHDPETLPLIQQLDRSFKAMSLETRDSDKAIDEALKPKLPSFSSTQMVAAKPLTRLDMLLKRAIDRCADASEADRATPAAKEVLLNLKASYEAMRKKLADHSAQLARIDTQAYDEVRSKIAASNSVVITVDTPAASAPKPPADASARETDFGVAVLGLNEIYFLQTNNDQQDKPQPERGYKGEEAITGALLRLKFKHKTKIVFINPFQGSVLEPGRPMSFSNVAEMLRKMNFEVAEWQPGGGSEGPGGAIRPQPRPVAEPGQKLIFVAMPSPPATKQQPFSTVAAAVAGAVKDQLDSGNPVLVFTQPRSVMTLGQSDPVVEALKPYGLNVNTSRLILSDSLGPIRAQINLKTWPSDHPVSKAVSGLNGVSPQALPIDIPANPPQGVKVWPLARTGADAWSDNEFDFNPEEGMFAPTRGTKHDASDPSGPFTIAAAATKGNQRVVVISDYFWAADGITRYGALYAEFPANAELFVNSVYWLAGHDDLIAPGSRTRDVRRVGTITPTVLSAIWWVVLLGMPMSMLGAGTLVWMIRRK